MKKITTKEKVAMFAAFLLSVAACFFLSPTPESSDTTKIMYDYVRFLPSLVAGVAVFRLTLSWRQNRSQG